LHRGCCGGHGHGGGRDRAEVLASQESAARLVPAACGPVAANRARATGAGVPFVQPTVGVPHGLGQRAAGRHAVVLGVVRPVTVLVVTAVLRAVTVGRHRRRLVMGGGRYRGRRWPVPFGQRYGRGHCGVRELVVGVDSAVAVNRPAGVSA